MMIRSGLLICILGIAVSTHGDEVVVRAAEITAFGVFEETGKRFVRGYDRKEPGTNSLERVRFTDYETSITGRIGTSFGIEYVIHSTPRGKPFRVTAVITYPPDGLIAPDGTVYHQSEEPVTIRLGEKSFYGFGFDQPWEIVPGKWIFQIKHGPAVLVQRTFTVSLP